MIEPKKINVVYIDGSVGFGGAAKSLGLLLKELSEQINTIVVTSQNETMVKTCYCPQSTIYRFRWIFNNLFYERLISKLDQILKSTLLRRIIMKLVSKARSVERMIGVLYIIRIVKKHDAHLIHCNTGLTLEGLSAARLLNVPCVVHMRGFPSGSKHEKSLIPSVSHFIAVSNAVKDALCINGVLHHNVSTVYDPVSFNPNTESSSVIREQLGVKDDEIAIGNFGRIVPWKGQSEFIDAVLEVLKSNDKIKAFIIGDESDSSSSYFDLVKKKVNDSKYSNNFVFTGFIEDVEPYYSAMDIVVHSSIEPEPFGMVVTEAMAAGKAVIATAAGGPVEIITNEYDGLLVSLGNIKDMSDAIKCLCSDEVKREYLATNAKITANARFGIYDHVSKVESIYKNICLFNK